jgi:hypothetical protein
MGGRVMMSLLGMALVAPGLLHAQSASGCEDLSGTPIHMRVDWDTEVRPLLVGESGVCGDCHSGSNAAGGFDLAAPFDELINDWHVVPGRPRQSVLFLAVNCEAPPTSRRMPLGNRLSRFQQELIHDWIAQGALGEPEDERILRRFLFRDGLESLR